MLVRNRLLQYAYLMRLHQPFGILLLLWPTMWGLWLASRGKPNILIVLIFMIGVIIMRSAGCIINDIADRQFDKYVTRTQDRPLAQENIRLIEAWINLVALGLIALLLVLAINQLTLILAFIGAGLTLMYPFMKRHTHLPQLFLGVAFAWGIPMAFAAVQNVLPHEMWVVYACGVIWPIIYDTLYAMVDRTDDLQVGVKSTAILFGNYDRVMIGLLQIGFMILLLYLGSIFALRFYYYLFLVVVAGLFGYQQYLIRDRNEAACFQAFLNNHWIGLFIFMGIFLGVR